MKIILIFFGTLLFFFGALILFGVAVAPSEFSFFEDLLGSILFGIVPVLLGGILIFFGLKIKQKD